MRRWRGVESHISDVGGDHLLAAQGASFHVEGELRRRAGLSELAAYTGVALGTFVSEISGGWLLFAESDGEVQAYRLADASVTDIGDVSVTKVPNFQSIQPRVYGSDDFTATQVWDGVWSGLRTAGIDAPDTAMPSPSGTAAGSTTAGVHLIRFRYVDSKSPQGRYRSNPSTALSYTVVAGSERLTFTINDTGSSAIKRSTDAKVDTIVVEMTTAGGSFYYVVAEAANTASSVVVDMADATLELQDTAASLGGDFGHEPPPVAAVLVECQGYGFACVHHKWTFSLCTATNGSPTITGTGFSTEWAGRLVRVESDAALYEIQSITSTTITLTENYAGTGGTGDQTIEIIHRQPNLVEYSERYYPESYKGATRAFPVLQGNGDTLVGAENFHGQMYFFGRRSMQRLVFTNDPVNGDLVPVAGDSGVWNQRCIVQPDEDTLLFFGSNGVFLMVGGRPRHISRGIDQDWRDLIDKTQSDEFHGAYHPATRTVSFWFTRTGETKPQDAVSIDMVSLRLRLDRWRQGIQASVRLVDNNGELRPVLADANGYTWYHSGDTDGVPSSSSGAYTTAGSGTTTTTPVNESLPTGSADLTGTMLYIPSTGEEVLISSNTSSVISHDAISGALAAGLDVYAGSIPWSIESSWWVHERLQDKKRPTYLHLAFNPSSTGEARVSIYRDFSSTPYTWTKDDGRVAMKGIDWNNGDTYCTVQLDVDGDGFASVPLPAEWSRALRWKIEVLSPAGTVRLMDAYWGMRDGRNIMDGAGE